MKRCPECESENIIKDADFIETDDGYDRHLKLAIDENPDAMIFKSRNYSSITADICADCGFVKMYALQTQVLWEAYLRRQENLPRK